LSVFRFEFLRQQAGLPNQDYCNVCHWLDKGGGEPYSERDKKIFRDIIEYRILFASAVMEILGSPHSTEK